MFDAFWEALGSPERCGCFFYTAWLLGEDFTTIHRQAVIPCQHLPELCSGEALRATIHEWKYNPQRVGICECELFLQWTQGHHVTRAEFWLKHDAAINWCTS